MHAAEPLVPKPSASEVETAIEKLTLGLRIKKTSYFYGTGYILCPYFKKQFSQHFFSRFDM